MSDAMRDMIAKHRTAVGMLRTELMLADLEVDASEAAVDWDMRGLVLSRRPIGRERLPSKISSPVRITAKISASSTTSNMASAVRRFVRTMRALTDRQRDIAPHLRSDGSEPAWSVLTSSTALHLMRTAGWSVEQMLTMHRTPEGHNSADERGFTVGLACSGSDGPGMLVQAHGLGLGGGHLHFSTLTFPDAPGISYRNGRSETIAIADSKLPDVVSTALAGRPLAEVVGHPLFKGCRSRISSATSGVGPTGGHDLVLKLAKDLVPMADSPDGVQRPWLDVLART